MRDCAPVSEVSLLQKPGASSARYDEMRDAKGAVRPHWEALADAFGTMSQREFSRRLLSADRMVRENGVTYNVYDDATGQARPWPLDIVPFVISPSDWRAIEAAVVQRARLADAIARDIYGPQK